MKCLLLCVLLVVAAVSGFTVHPTVRVNAHPSVAPRAKLFFSPPPLKRCGQSHSQKTVSRYMYNLPPGGGGGRNNDLKGLLSSVLGVALVIAFFASPLGGFVFAIVNSFLALAFITPVVLWAGFQGWQFFNTIQGPCPNCSAPLRVLKDSSPSICLNCGTVVQASADKTGIEAVSSGGRTSRSIFEETDPFMGGFFDDSWGASRNPTSAEQKRQDERRRQGTIIDVDIEDEGR